MALLKKRLPLFLVVVITLLLIAAVFWYYGRKIEGLRHEIHQQVAH